MIPFNPLTDTILKELTAIVSPANVSTAISERQLRATDMSHHEAHLSEVVVWPMSSQEVAGVLRVANEQRVPVTPWGAGSSLEGNPIPLCGGITLSMERMNDIVHVYEDDFQVTVQPGIGYKDLNESLGRHGLFFAPDPGANASIGGMLANNAAGTRTVKYGATKDNVLEMEVVLADGRTIHVGSRSIKQSAGYDLLHLFIGSEGTLGVITEATLKLVPIPEVMSGVVASFPSVESAIEAVVAVRGSGLDVAALEFLDEEITGILVREDALNWRVQPTLLMEIHATHAAAAELDLAQIREICEDLGATGIVATVDPSERKKMWRSRHHMFETAVRVFSGHRWQLTDVAVPISAFPQLVAHTRETLQADAVHGFIIGHAGDGNMHLSMPYKDDAAQLRAAKVADSIVYKALELDGTSTGEHGVGIGKAKFMEREHGTATAVMRSLKETLDPNGILNPGKILPPAT